MQKPLILPATPKKFVDSLQCIYVMWALLFNIFNQSINQSINRSIDRSIDRSINQTLLNVGDT